MNSPLVFLVKIMAGPLPIISATPEARFRASYEQLYPFQREVFDTAVRHNTIIHLPTGAGKTVVAQCLAAFCLWKKASKKVVMLVNRIPLILQQATVLANAGLQVAQVCSDRKDAASWADFMSRRFDAVVIIDSLFYQWLSLDPTALKHVGMLIFDEVHWLRKSSWYAKIAGLVLSEQSFAVHEGDVHIIGLTASPGAEASREETRDRISTLLELCDCRIVTVVDNTRDLVERVPVPQCEVIEFAPHPDECDLQDAFRVIASSVVTELYQSQYFGSPLLRGELQNLSSLALGSIPFIYRCREVVAKGISSMCEALKLIGTLLKVVGSCLLFLEEVSMQAAVQHLCRNDELEFLWSPLQSDDLGRRTRELLQRCAVGPMIQLRFKMLQWEGDRVSHYFEGSRFSALVGVLAEFANNVFREKNDFRGIIFCDTKTAVHRIVRHLTNHPDVGWMQPRCFVGHAKTVVDEGETLGMTASQQAQTLQAFRAGGCQLLVATSVAEEGLDVPICSLVIRYEGQFTVQSFIQSRGRARKQGAYYAAFLRHGAANSLRSATDAVSMQDEVVMDLMHHGVRGMPLAASSSSAPPESTAESGTDFSTLFSGGPTPSSSRGNLLWWQGDPLKALMAFCSSKGVQPTFNTRLCAGNWQVSVNFDLIVEGTTRLIFAEGVGNESRARQLCCLKACQQLHAFGLLAQLVRSPLAPMFSEKSYSDRAKVAFVSGISLNRWINGKLPFAEKDIVDSYDPDEWGVEPESLQGDAAFRMSNGSRMSKPFDYLDKLLRTRRLPEAQPSFVRCSGAADKAISASSSSFADPSSSAAGNAEEMAALTWQCVLQFPIKDAETGATQWKRVQSTPIAMEDQEKALHTLALYAMKENGTFVVRRTAENLQILDAMKSLHQAPASSPAAAGMETAPLSSLPVGSSSFQVAAIA